MSGAGLVLEHAGPFLGHHLLLPEPAVPIGLLLLPGLDHLSPGQDGHAGLLLPGHCLLLPGQDVHAGLVPGLLCLVLAVLVGHAGLLLLEFGRQ